MADLPIGGDAGQVLTKQSNIDNDVDWGNGGGLIDGLVPPGGNIGDVLTKTGIPSYNMDWVPPAGVFDDSHLVALDGSRPMTGPLLLLLAPPTINEEAANKQYVDNSIVAVPPFDDSHLLALDGTRPMEAELILVGPPTVALAATTKAYVDGLVTGDIGSLLIGAVNASTGMCRFVPGLGFVDGPIPPATNATANDYLLCEEAGTIPGVFPGGGLTLGKGDWLFCTGIAWINFEVGTGLAVIASDVATIPPVFGANDVQAALEAAEARIIAIDPTGRYLLLAGGTLTGMLVLPATVPTLPTHATNKQYVDDRSLPPGGAAGMVLAKIDGVSFNADWIAIPTSLVPIGPTPPANPQEGQLWFRDTDLDLYIWYNDGQTTNWVPASTGNANGLPPGGAPDEVLTKLSANNFDAAWRTPVGGGLVDDTNYYVNRTPQGSTSGNLDQQTGIGCWIYQDTGTTNQPPKQQAGLNCQWLIHNVRGGGNIIQEAFELFPALNNASAYFAKWMRHLSINGAWTAWIRQPIEEGLPLSGGRLTGDLILPAGTPPTPESATNKAYVDSSVASGSLYQGAWQVAANNPNLLTLTREHGMRFLCQTVNPNNPETANAAIPGIGGKSITNGSFIIWDAVVAGGQWDLLANTSGGLSQDAADLRYLRLIGGTATGKILTPATLAADPATTLATKGYIDDKIFNDAGVGPWVGVTNGAQWTGTSVQCRLINGGANIQCRGKVSFNNQAFSGTNFQAFQLPTTHTPGGIGGAVSPATDDAQAQTTLRSSMSFNWNTGDRWIYASRTYTTVASPRIASIDLIIPRT